jgi:hypothetical protein
MKLQWIPSGLVAMALLMAAPSAQAASITGTVTNKTTGKPSAGDSVVLVDVQASMADAASATTDAHGHYSLESPGGGAYLIRVNHQGGTYFIAAPQGSGPGDVTVYDIAAKVDSVGIDADMILAEAAGGMLRVQERYLVRNNSLPPKAQFSGNTFEFVIPAGALLDGASATRPGGMATNTRPVPLGQKQHYTINIPIQPNQGEKETLFEVQYHLSYNGKYTFAPQPQMPADNLVIYVPKGMNFSASSGSSFQPAQEDPRVQTFVAKSIKPGQAVSFTLSGEGQMPREAQSGAIGQQSGGMGDSGATDAGVRPGGGLGVPIDTPDPISKYKWWVLGLLSIALAAAAAFFLRKNDALAASTPASASNAEPVYRPASAAAPAVPIAAAITPATSNVALLNILKDELFAIESEKLSGVISAREYDEVKIGLEAVLKRALKNRPAE